MHAYLIEHLYCTVRHRSHTSKMQNKEIQVYMIYNCAQSLGSLPLYSVPHFDTGTKFYPKPGALKIVRIYTKTLKLQNPLICNAWSKTTGPLIPLRQVLHLYSSYVIDMLYGYLKILHGHKNQKTSNWLTMQKNKNQNQV